MTSKLGVIIATRRAFKGKVAQLLQPGQIEPRITLIVTVRNIPGAWRCGLFLPVDACAYVTVPQHHTVGPLNIILLHIIQCGRGVIAAIIRIIVVVFAMAIARNQLRLDKLAIKT